MHGRYWIGVFILIASTAWICYSPALSVPLLNYDDIVIVYRALHASMKDLFLGRIDWDLPEEIGRSFRPLPILSYRFDRLFLMSDLGPAYRGISLLWASFLGTLCFSMIVHFGICKTVLEYSAAVFMGLMTTISRVMCDVAVCPTERSNILLAIYFVWMAFLLIHGGLQPDNEGKSVRIYLLSLFIAIFGACVCKENGIFLSVLLVSGSLFLIYFGKYRRTLSFYGQVIGTTLGALVLFLVYKYVALGWDQLFPVQRQALFHLTPKTYIVEVLLKIFSSATPTLWFIKTARISDTFVTFFLYLVLRQTFWGDRKTRLVLRIWLIGFLANALFPLPYASRHLVPSYCFWMIAAGISIVRYLQGVDMRWVRQFVLGGVAFLMFLQAIVAYNNSLQIKSYNLYNLYIDLPFKKDVYNAVLLEQRHRYRPLFVREYKTFVLTESPAEQFVHKVGGWGVWKSVESLKDIDTKL